MTKKQIPQASLTNANQVRKQNQNPMQEEFGSETDVNEVRQQNQQAEMNKAQASGRAGSFGKQSQ
ncbi:gamma-type small acid-soluble spore protein [Sporosarcina sp. ACRSL]|uniref:gamma-type small acid-soluble spore protein n=1 Tax=Sporosarcina sp. ACRSL TaxID=2918215 RepID=UPI001EF4DCE8|nr:gamma-type small acid-soluble spore protein [Sporosarcina sp. ACRSL]MCG7345760.1 gamma-type small acid-soluble spore protein [Sporosarcina sp. ACRSL]